MWDVEDAALHSSYKGRVLAARGLTYEDIFLLREASDPRLSPDARTVAFVVTSADPEADENRSSIWCIPADGGEPSPLTRGRSDTHPRWAPGGRRLAFLRSDGDGPPQVWILPVHGGEAEALTDLPLGASGFAWSPDGSRLAVLAPVDLDGEPADDEERERRRRAPREVRTVSFKADGAGFVGNRRVHLFVVDVAGGRVEQLTKGDLNVGSPAWSPDGGRVAFAGSAEDRDTSARTHLYVISTQGGEPDEVVDWDGTAASPTFSPDGTTLLFVGQPRPGALHSRLYTVPAGGGDATELAPDLDRNVMVGAPGYPGAPPLFWDDDRVLFCARDRGCTNAYVVSEGRASRVAGDGERVVNGLTASGDRMAYVLSAPDIPADVFTSTADGSGETRLTRLNSELLDEIRLHPHEERTFTAPDGTAVHGWVIRGDGPEPGPLLVDVHGGPHNAWSPTFDAVHLYHEALASQGWSILRLNPRGSDGYGEDFYTAVVGRWGLADEHDFLSAVDALVDDGIADPERLAVAGYSYGGHMANWLTGRTDRFAAGVSGGCLSNITSFYGSADLGFWLGAFEMGGEQYAERERFAELSPLSYVEHVTAPTLLLHGEEDLRCPIGQAEEWFVSLRRLGREAELVRYPGASHLFILNGRPSHRVDYNRRIVDWLTRHC